MILVGLTGGIGVGKSTVAAMFAARGAAVVDADRISRRLQEPGAPCYGAIVEAFGRGILDSAGRIDRRAPGRRSCSPTPPAAQRSKRSCTPPSGRPAKTEIRAAAAAGRAVCVVEAALILETGQRSRFQRIVVVTAPTDVQVDASGAGPRPHGGGGTPAAGGAVDERGQGAPGRSRHRQRRGSGGDRAPGRDHVFRFALHRERSGCHVLGPLTKPLAQTAGPGSRLSSTAVTICEWR